MVYNPDILIGVMSDLWGVLRGALMFRAYRRLSSPKIFVKVDVTGDFQPSTSILPTTSDTSAERYSNLPLNQEG